MKVEVLDAEFLDTFGDIRKGSFSICVLPRDRGRERGGCRMYLEIQEVLKLLTSQGREMATVDDVLERYTITRG